MTRSARSFAELFLPPRGKRARARAASPDASPAVQAIWEVICTIPRGQVSTYGAVARAAGFPGRARLTGYALRTAPDDLLLPWHRVVGAGGRISFPKSSAPYREQTKRLRAEGIALKEGRVDPARIADI
jgi:methylated-DNA-protein-cysteine methyltransferase-like protein